ncbi:MAG: cysteine desulfurase [Agathobacter sp.]|nr:cysteine desulfurase [Agathobacter sp.]
MNNRIYLDHAATTDMLPEVAYAMEPYYIKKYGNASATYELGAEAKRAIELARESIAASIHAKPSEIFFTSGGSEADNWAVKGMAGERKQQGKHVVTSKIEHHAILHSCEHLEKLGYRVSYLDVDQEGIVKMADLEQLIRAGERSHQLQDKITLISIMYGNNEVGTLQPVEEIGALARKHQIPFHTDAVQAVGQVPISVKRLPIDMLSSSAHKFHGPKGVGFLYVREGVNLPSFIHGGGQESGKRAGTENVAGIVGMAKALSIATKEVERKAKEVAGLRNYFIKRVMQEIPEVRLNGHSKKRLPGNANLSFHGVSGTALLVLLEEEGIYASAGSACSAGSTRLSHVIKAIAVPKEYAYGTIRFTLGRETTREELDRTISVLKKSVKILRQEE